MKALTYSILTLALGLGLASGAASSPLREASPLEAGNFISVTAAVESAGCRLSVATDIPSYQMPFLMQGLTLHISSCTPECPDTLTVLFPRAAQVRHLIKRHPNQVKPTFTGSDSIAGMKRPDLLPLINALNAAHAACLSTLDARVDTLPFSISLIKESATLTFLALVDSARAPALLACDSLAVTLLSMPPVERQEYEGRRLSSESRRNPHGFGQGMVGADTAVRRITLTHRIPLLSPHKPPISRQK